jgi:hypothetical protein
MIRYLIVLTAFFILPLTAQAASLWNKAENTESRIPYSVTSPGQGWSLKNLWQKPGVQAKQKTSITANTPRPAASSFGSTEPHNLGELQARAAMLKAPQMAAFESMRAENLKKAEALNKLAAARATQPSLLPGQTGAAQAPVQKAPRKTIYLRPATTQKPAKTFPDSY